MYFTTHPSPLGLLTLKSDGENLLALWFGEQRYQEAREEGEERANGDLKVFRDVKKWLNAYFARKNPGLSSIPLAPKGSDFRKEVWEIILQIPYGRLRTYGDIAELIAMKRGIRKMSARAVGTALGHNPISIIIPCHRVVGARGNIGGYFGCLDRKIKLLELEGNDVKKLFKLKNG
jgi:methylated-DNA-[protein]-cysteine S-methyltransferase